MAHDSAIHVHALIERVRRGDRKAFDRLAGRYRERLLSVIRLRFGPEARRCVDPEDVLQETLLRAYLGLKSFTWEGHARFIAWLTTIAERAGTDLLRSQPAAPARRRKRQQGSQAVEDSPPGPRNEPLRDGAVATTSATEPAGQLRRHERFDRLERALDRLSPDHREVIVLSVLQCLPTREVGERMGLSSGAVCMLRTRALTKLREIFGDTESLRLPARVLEPGRERRTDSERPSEDT